MVLIIFDLSTHLCSQHLMLFGYYELNFNDNLVSLNILGYSHSFAFITTGLLMLQFKIIKNKKWYCFGLCCVTLGWKLWRTGIHVIQVSLRDEI